MKMNLLLISGLTVFLIFFIWLYFFNVYEVKFNQVKILKNKINYVRIYPVLLNSFGMKIPFRKTFADFKILDSEKKNYKSLRLKELEARLYKNQDVEIICTTKYNLFAEKIILVSN